MKLHVLSQSIILSSPSVVLTNDEIIDPCRVTVKRAQVMLKSYGVNHLLTSSNPKVEKNMKRGYFTKVLHLAPGNLSGYEVCPSRTAGCTTSCLNTAGNPVYLKLKLKARIARTKFFFEQPDLFKALLIHEIDLHVKMARKLRLKPCMRLNGTSDIAWERKFPMLFMKFRTTQFYCYTKIAQRMLPGWPLPKNYHLTFSRSESNWGQCEQILNAGGTVTVVMGGYGTSIWPKAFPDTFGGYPTVDGDRDDLRFLDEPGHVIALRAKGKARQDRTDFVVW